MALKIATAAADAMGAALATHIGTSSVIEIRSGTRPATPTTSSSGTTLLASVAISGVFTSSSGVLTAADPASVTVLATADAAWFRLRTSAAGANGVGVIDGSVTQTGGGGDMQLATVSLTSGATLDLGVPSITVPVA